MLIELCSYNNRWRDIEPSVKIIFTFLAFVSVSIASNPFVLFIMAFINMSFTIFGAKVAYKNYFKILIPVALFIIFGGVTLAISLSWSEIFPWVNITFEKTQLVKAAFICSRSFASVTVLLFLTLTTPVTDIMAFLRRLKLPQVFLDIMLIGYRMISIFMETVVEIHVAQTARLGHVTFTTSFRSFSLLVTTLFSQVWRRAKMLHMAAVARCNEGPLLFLEREYSKNSFFYAASLLVGTIFILLSQVNF